MQSPGFLQRKLAAFGWEDTFCQSGHGWWRWGWELVNITACCPLLSNFFRCTPVIQKVTPRSNLADYPSDQRSFVSNSFWVRAAPIRIRNYLFRNLYSIYRREYRLQRRRYTGALRQFLDQSWGEQHQQINRLVLCFQALTAFCTQNKLRWKGLPYYSSGCP